jgi:Uma2 family endonuclease
MSALANKHWTAEEYLAFERASEERYEFFAGAIHLISGSSRNHNLIVVNTFTSLHYQTTQHSHEVYANAMRVRVNKRDYVYPDVVVVCGEPQLEDDQLDTLLNPTLIIEVLSPSTEKYDRDEKFRSYCTLQSLQEYVLISQHTPRIERYLRHEDGQWLYVEVSGLESSVELTSIGCTLALVDVYNKMRFEEE